MAIDSDLVYRLLAEYKSPQEMPKGVFANYSKMAARTREFEVKASSSMMVPQGTMVPNTTSTHAPGPPFVPAALTAKGIDLRAGPVTVPLLLLPSPQLMVAE